MKYSKIVFTVAGIYGLVMLVPQYFLESRNAVEALALGSLAVRRGLSRGF